MISSIQRNQFYANNSLNNNTSKPKQQNFAAKNQPEPSFQGKGTNLAMSLLTLISVNLGHAAEQVAPQKALVEEIGTKVMAKLSEKPNPFKALTGFVLRPADKPQSNEVVVTRIIGTCDSITNPATTMKKKFVPEISQTEAVELNMEECGGRFTLGAKKLTPQEEKQLAEGKPLEEIQSSKGIYGFFMEGQIPKSGNPEEMAKFTDNISKVMEEQCK